jgi:hypothetical protein
VTSEASKKRFMETACSRKNRENRVDSSGYLHGHPSFASSFSLAFSASISRSIP